MKYYILLIYLLAFSLATEGNTAVKDSLSEALPSASSPLQKLEIMTNLMDLSRQEEQVEYALSDSLGFGGHNACVIFKRWEG